MRFLKGFLYAFQGIAYCISHERNMRIHTVALLYVSAFSLFFQLSRVEYAVLFLTFALVMMAEMVNTAIERLCDKTAKEYHPLMQRIWRPARYWCALFLPWGWQSVCLEMQRCTRLFGAGF